MSSNYCGIMKPSILDAGCWVAVNRHVRSLFGGATNCGRRPRAECLTCRYHAHYESEAQYYQRALIDRQKKAAEV